MAIETGRHVADMKYTWEKQQIYATRYFINPVEITYWETDS
jgi:hypothetical protein